MPKNGNENSWTVFDNEARDIIKSDRFRRFNVLMALQTSASETGPRDRNSEHCERRGKSIEEQLLWTDWTCLAKASAIAVDSAESVPSTFSWIEPDLCFPKLDMNFQKCWGFEFKLLSTDFNHLRLPDLMVSLTSFL
jgi:hypothetical protein